MNKPEVFEKLNTATRKSIEAKIKEIAYMEKNNVTDSYFKRCHDFRIYLSALVDAGVITEKGKEDIENYLSDVIYFS